MACGGNASAFRSDHRTWGRRARKGALHNLGPGLCPGNAVIVVKRGREGGRSNARVFGAPAFAGAFLRALGLPAPSAGLQLVSAPSRTTIRILETAATSLRPDFFTPSQRGATLVARAFARDSKAAALPPHSTVKLTAIP